MSNLWKEIKDNVKEWSAAAIKKADEVSKLAVEKTGDFTKISKIKLDIRQTQKDIDNTFEDLGRYVYTEFNDTIKTLDDFKTKINNFEKEIDNIKKEVEKAEVVEKPKVTKKPRAKTTTKAKTQTKKTTKTTAKK